MKTLQKLEKNNFLQKIISLTPESITILKNIGWLFQGRMVNYVFQFGVGIYTIKQLGPENYGAFTYCYAITSFFSTVVGFGLRENVIRELVKEPDQKNKILGTSITLMFITGALSYLLSIILVYILRPNDIQSLKLVAVLSISLLLIPTNAFTFFYDANLQAKKTVISQNAGVAFTSLSKVLVVINKKSLYWYSIATILENVVNACGLLYITIKDKIYKGLYFDKKYGTELLKISWPLAASNLAVWLYMRVDQVMIRDLSSDYQTGIYATAMRFIDAIYFIPMIIQSSFLPKIINSKKINSEKFEDSLFKLNKILVIMSYIIIIGFVLTIKPFIIFFLGDKFIESANVSIILVFTLLFVSIGVARNAYIYTLNLNKYQLKITLTSSILNIILNFILIPLYGAIGAVISILITQIYSTLISSFIYKPLRQSGVIALKAIILKKKLY
jgi:PST family polysaccharide transporter